MKWLRISSGILILISLIWSILIGNRASEETKLAIGAVTAIAILLIAVSGFFSGRRPSFSFAKSAGKTQAKETNKTTFKNVAANENALRALSDLTDFLKHPEKYTALGARLPRGVLLYGPPGTGKTLLARALAGEADVPFIAMSGSDFVEMYVGVGAGRIRDVFRRAKKHGKCVIFIDEIDSLGRSRGTNSSDERDQTLNALLSEMNGFSPNDGIIVIGATNRMEIMDPALLRPGRFDMRIEVGMPGKAERLDILKLHAENKPVSKEVNLPKLAEQTVFFSGASLESLLNDAAISAARRNSDRIENSDIASAYIRQIAGDDRISSAGCDEKMQIALHEAGHAVTARLLMPKQRIKRISILPSSSGAAGYNLAIPEEKTLHTKADMENSICMLLSGRAAEALVFGEGGTTGGAASDLKRATEAAVLMATELGMGDRPYANEKLLSSAPGGASRAFESADRILKQQYERAMEILCQNSAFLTALSKALIESEALEEEEIDELFTGFDAESSNECENSLKFEKV